MEEDIDGMYGFSGDLSAEFPSQINFDVTEFCNLACVHCPYEEVTKVKGPKRQHLSEDLHRKAIDEIASDGLGLCKFIRYTGDGEPLLHPGLADLLTYARARTGLPINLTTNGLLLTADKIEALLEAGVTAFDISLDAHKPETYAKIRRKGDLAIAHENIRRLIAENRVGGYGAQVIVSFVRQPLNEGEVEDFRAFWEAESADFVLIRTLHSCAGHLKEIKDSMWSNAPNERMPCVYPWERLVVKPDGKVAYCPADWLHLSELGSIADQTLKETWKGSDMEALREAHLKGDFSRHSFCGQCPDWMAMKWPHEGRRYSMIMEDPNKLEAKTSTE